MALSDRLTQLGISHAAAGRAIGRKRSTVSMYCSGERIPRNHPDEPTQLRIKELWGIPIEWWGQWPAEERREGAAA